MNEFYSIRNSNNESESPHQLENIGNEIPWVTLGKRGSNYWGTSGSDSKTYYKKTTPEDYDGSFAFRLTSIKPPYEIYIFLNFHLSYYIGTVNGNHEKFIKHIKYVILPLIKKQQGKEVYLELLDEWIEENSTTKSLKNIQNVSIINTGDINAPTQFQQNGNNSNQTQNISYSAEDIKQLFTSLRKDIESLSNEITLEFETEIVYASKQLEKGNDIKKQLLNIGKLIKEVGINIFANVAASPIYEVLKPHLGL